MDFAAAMPLAGTLGITMKVGKRLSVWQTRIRTEDGAEVALVTQTQMALWPA